VLTIILQSLVEYKVLPIKRFSMTTITTNIEIQAPVEQVFEFYTNSDNIKEAWPRDIVKESENLSGHFAILKDP